VCFENDAARTLVQLVDEGLPSIIACLSDEDDTVVAVAAGAVLNIVADGDNGPFRHICLSLAGSSTYRRKEGGFVYDLSIFHPL
jgi:hypothetical protein